MIIVIAADTRAKCVLDRNGCARGREFFRFPWLHFAERDLTHWLIASGFGLPSSEVAERRSSSFSFYLDESFDISFPSRKLNLSLHCGSATCVHFKTNYRSVSLFFRRFIIEHLSRCRSRWKLERELIKYITWYLVSGIKTN